MNQVIKVKGRYRALRNLEGILKPGELFDVLVQPNGALPFDVWMVRHDTQLQFIHREASILDAYLADGSVGEVDVNNFDYPVEQRSPNLNSNLDISAQKAQGYDTFQLDVNICHCCGGRMMVLDDRSKHFYRFQEQMQAKGIRRESFNYKHVCRQCEEEGKLRFTCDLCKQERPTDRIQESIGDSAEYLCRDCYESVTAAVWQEALDQLNGRHWYDWE